MKIIKYILFSLVGLLASASFSACESPDKEFEHDNNLIAWMTRMAISCLPMR